MQVSRRNFSFGIAALGLSACVGGGSISRPSAPAAMPMVPDAGFDAWVQAFRPRALAKGVSGGTFDAAFRALRPNEQWRLFYQVPSARPSHAVCHSQCGSLNSI